MAATAAALLEWQPVFVLEKENYALREENRHLHFQVNELMQWKERALKQMLALGPKRQRAQRDVQHATQLQKKLHSVEKSLLERGTLAQTNALLQQKEALLEARVGQLQQQHCALETQLTTVREREESARAHLQSVADAFRAHLEQLVAIREQIDDGGESSKSKPTPTVQEEEEEEEHENGDRFGRRGDASDSETLPDPTVLVAGLSAVSDKCLRWFHQHVAQTFSTIQEKAARYEAQHEELEQLRTRVQSIRQNVEFSAVKEKQQSQQLLTFQSEKAQLEAQIQRLRALHVHHTHGHSQLSDHVRLLVTEVRQYLRLVRAEIKKKFGYLPEAITHADSWARILDAMDVLERQLRLAQS